MPFEDARLMTDAEAALLGLPEPCHVLGPLDFSRERRVAIVGAREAHALAVDYARGLACTLGRAGCVIVSGGAAGIDRAAHEGALDANAPTWIMIPSGWPDFYPKHHGEFFAHVADRGGTLVWTHLSGIAVGRGSTFHRRNAVIAQASHAMVVVQAASVEKSGAFNAGKYALSKGLPVWAPAGAPLLDGFAGNVRLIEDGARTLLKEGPLLASLGAAPPAPAQLTLPFAEESVEARIWSVLHEKPKHQEILVAETGIAPFATQVALLTLTLENVVVEGPPGYFRRATVR